MTDSPLEKRYGLTQVAVPDEDPAAGEAEQRAPAERLVTQARGRTRPPIGFRPAGCSNAPGAIA